SLHLLHHSVWTRQFAVRAAGRSDRGSTPPGREWLCGDRADRRRPYFLWRRSAGHAVTWAIGGETAEAGAEPETTAAVFHRFHRSRRRPDARHCRRRTADAAFSSFRAIGR